MSPRLHHWGLALLCALSAHIALAKLLEPPAPIDPNPPGVRIGLGGSGPMTAGSVEPGPVGAESVHAEAIDGVSAEADVVEPGRVDAIQPMPSPSQTLTPVQAVTQTLKATEVPPPAPVTAVDLKEPVTPKPKAEPARNREPPAQRTAQAAPEPPVGPKPKQSQPARSQTKSTTVDQAKPTDRTAGTPGPAPTGSNGPAARKGGDGGGHGGAAASAGGGKTQDRYYAELAAWLERHKRYPQRARQMRQEGVVRIRFAINRTGKVISHSVEKSSGHRALDEAASELLRRASPMPAIPPALGQSRLEIVVPIAYRLR